MTMAEEYTDLDLDAFVYNEVQTHFVQFQVRLGLRRNEVNLLLADSLTAKPEVLQSVTKILTDLEERVTPFVLRRIQRLEKELRDYQHAVSKHRTELIAHLGIAYRGDETLSMIRVLIARDKLEGFESFIERLTQRMGRWDRVVLGLRLIGGAMR